MQREESALIGFLANLRYEDIPEEARREAAVRLLDQVGVIIGGVPETPAQIAIEYAIERGGRPEALILGTDVRVDAEHGAFANGVAGHVLELDDGNRFAMGHPGVVVVPAVLAMAEATRATGRDVVAAIVVGYELFVRLGTAVNPSHYDRGFHTTGTIGAMAATAAVARLLRLDEATFGSALGLAGSQAAGLFEFLADGVMSKQLHAGVAASAAIRSVRLARAGFTGPRSVLQGANGLMRAMADASDAGVLAADLGRSWAVQDCYVKLHACCRHIHPVVDAVAALMQRHALTADDLVRLEVGTYKFAAKLDKKRVDTDLDAKMSIPYSIAATLLEGACGLHQFRPELFHDARVVSVMDRVEVALDLELDALVPQQRGCRVVATTASARFEEEALLPRGEPEIPVERAEIEQKYADLVRRTFDAEHALATVQALLTIDVVEDVAELVVALEPSVAVGRTAAVPA